MVDAALLRSLVLSAANDGVAQLVVGAVIEVAGSVLLLHRPPQDFMGGIFELPSGKVNSGETLDAALCREVREETGLVVADIGELVGIFDYISGSGRKSRQFTFAVTVESKEPIRLSEHDRYQWTSLRGELPVTPAVRELLNSYRNGMA